MFVKGQCANIVFMQSHLSVTTCFIMNAVILMNVWSKWQNIFSNLQLPSLNVDMLLRAVWWKHCDSCCQLTPNSQQPKV